MLALASRGLGKVARLLTHDHSLASRVLECHERRHSYKY